jgi:spermidine/putrescine transport system substrate-binding protein
VTTSPNRGYARLTRRGTLSLAGLAALSGLAACSESDSANSGQPTPSGSPSTTEPTGSGATSLVWAQWPGYIDKKGKRRPTLDDFVAATGIEVTYREVINDNVEYVDSIRAELEAGNPVGADVVTLTTWMASRLVRADLMQPFVSPENAENVISALARPDYDPDQRFAMPWQAGLTGIAYDARRVGRAIGSLDEFFTRPDLKGRVGILTEFGDSVGLSMLTQGKDLAAGSVVDAADGVDYLNSRAADGWFGGYYGNDFVDGLAKGEIDAGLAWSGDTIQAQIDNPFLKFVIPEEGAMIWADNLMVPKGSRAADAATKLADYYYQPDVAARLAAWVNYICPVEGAQEEMQKLDPDLAANPLIFPDQTLLDRCYQYPTLPVADDDLLRDQFSKIVSS